MERDEYFEWLYRIINKDTGAVSYQKLIWQLYNTDFIIVIRMDRNRAGDGVDLRRRFFLDTGLDTDDRKKCSVLEMMVALAIRCEETIMDNPSIGDRTKQWFWIMVKNLGLMSMTDDNYDEEYVATVLHRFLKRDYSEDGKGGLFYIPDCQHNMRRVEIWMQLLWYLDSVILY